jgi:hypothetical protein
MNFGFSILDFRLREQKITRETTKKKILVSLLAILLLSPVHLAH